MKKLTAIVIVIVLIALSFSRNKKKQIIFTKNAPIPIGPYSQAVKAGHTLYVSGQIALRPDGVLDTSTIENECKQVLENIKVVLEAGGKKISDVTKASIYTTDLKHFSRINEVYKIYFSLEPPARETVEVSALPKGAHVEISVIAE